jgi:hypothetical protein
LFLLQSEPITDALCPAAVNSSPFVNRPLLNARRAARLLLRLQPREAVPNNRARRVGDPSARHLLRSECSERKVYLLADTRAKNKDVGIVVDQIRLAGIANLVILANKLSAR